MEVSNVLGSPITRDEHQYQQQHYYRPTYSLPVNIDVNHNSKSDITTPTPQKPIPAFHPQTTAILHDDELHYNHNNTTVCRSDSISSQPYAFSPRTSLSSGSMFSSLDSPSSERWLNTDFDHDIHSPRRFRMTFTNTDPYNRQQIERCAQEQTLNQNESTYSPTEKRGSKDVLSQGEFGSRRNTDIESSAGQYYRTSFKSEKEVLGKQENLVPRSMWWILVSTFFPSPSPIICNSNLQSRVVLSDHHQSDHLPSQRIYCSHHFHRLYILRPVHKPTYLDVYQIQIIATARCTSRNNNWSSL